VKGARQNKPDKYRREIPADVMTVVTGVSGSGKSSLVNDVLFNALQHHYKGTALEHAEFNSIGAISTLMKGVEYVDQNPIGSRHVPTRSPISRHSTRSGNSLLHNH
jgi:excinuclease ABC subunit A